MLNVVLLSVVAPAQAILMFASKAGAYLSEAPPKWSTLGQAPHLTHDRLTRLERLARDKLSSLFDPFVNYKLKKVISLTLVHEKIYKLNEIEITLTLFRIMISFR
jgi:hypothetical protein